MKKSKNDWDEWRAIQRVWLSVIRLFEFLIMENKFILNNCFSANLWEESAMPVLQQWPWAQVANKLTERNRLHPAPLMTSIVEWVFLIWQSQIMRDEAECSCANYFMLGKSSAIESLQFSFYCSCFTHSLVDYHYELLSKQSWKWRTGANLLQSSVNRSVWAHIPYVWVTVPVGNQVETLVMYLSSVRWGDAMQGTKWCHKQHFWNNRIITFS